MTVKKTFSIVIIFTVLQIILMTCIVFFNTKRIQDMNYYKYVQSEAKATLSQKIINYLSDVQLRGFSIGTAYDDWVAQEEAIDQKFKFLLEAPVTKTFSSDFETQLKQMFSVWTMLKQRLSNLENVFLQMQNLKYSNNSEKTRAEIAGIKLLIEEYEGKTEATKTLSKLLEQIEKEEDGIYRLYTSLSRLMLQNEYSIEDQLEKTEFQVKVITIIIALLSCIILSFSIILTIKKMHKDEMNLGLKLFEQTQTLVVAAKENAATAQDQSAAVKEIVATMEESNELSENISRKIKNVSQIAEKTSLDVQDGVSSIEKNVNQLHEIFRANKETIEGMKHLDEKIKTIWDIVSLINNVADQAKIIAFNAELEASNAGEAGKSFRIVANEIRRLSDGIIDGTKEIKQRINEIQQSSDLLILTSKNGTKQINEGYENAKNLKEKFESIKGSAEVTAGSAGDITEIIQQQASASEQILITLKQISIGVENFSTATDNISASSENIRTMSESMTDIQEKEAKKAKKREKEEEKQLRKQEKLENKKAKKERKQIKAQIRKNKKLEKSTNTKAKTPVTTNTKKRRR